METEPAATELLIRPSQPDDKRITFLWKRGVLLAEIIYAPGVGLSFVCRGTDGTIRQNQTSVEGYSTLEWVGEYARAGDLLLPCKFEKPESLHQIAEECRAFIRRYFDCDKGFESVAVLYALHTWIYERFHAVPYLRFLGPPESGKTRGSETIGALCYRRLVIAGSVTSAPMFHMIEALGGTVLIDEADFKDTQVGSDIIKILNCGYQQGMSVSRLDKTASGRWVPRRYTVFGPKIINGRKRFEDEATETRCLSYSPYPTNRPVPVQLPEEFHVEAVALRNQLLGWRFQNLDSVEPSRQIIGGVSKRMSQIISPLLTVVEMMQGPGQGQYRMDLLDFAAGAASQTREVAAESVEALIVEILLEKPELTTCGEIKDAVIYERPEVQRWLSAQRVGKIVRENLGLQTVHRNKGSVIVRDVARLEGLKRRYGIVVTESSPVSDSVITLK